MSGKHTPEPVVAFRNPMPIDGWSIRTPASRIVADLMTEAEAKEYAATRNACVGISTEALEAGAIPNLREACLQAIGWLESEAATPSEPMTPPTEMLRVLRAALKAAGQEIE